MCLGCNLIRPQRFELPDLHIRELDLTLDLFKRGHIAFRTDGIALQLTGQVCQQAVENLLLNHRAEIDRLSARLSEWMAPFNAGMTGFLLGLEGKKCDAAVDYILTHICDLFEQIDKEKIDAALTDLFDMLSEEMQDSIHNLFDEMIGPAIDQMVEVLEGDYAGGSLTSDAFNRFMLAKDLARLKKALLDVAHEIPAFTKENYLDPILEFVRNSPYLDDLETVRNIVLHSREVVDKLLELIDALSEHTAAPGNGPGRYLWYAGWLLNDHFWDIDGKICKGPLFTLEAAQAANLDAQQITASVATRFSDAGYPISLTSTAQVDTPQQKWQITDGNQQFYLHQKSAGQKIKVYFLYPETAWHHIAPMANYTFKTVNPTLADEWAFHSSWLVDMISVVVHALSMEPTGNTGRHSNAFSNLGNLLTHLTYGGLKLGGPKGCNWNQTDLHLESFWAKSAIPFVTTLAASFEGIHRNSGNKAPQGARFTYWLNLAGADITQKQLCDHWCRLLRDAFLSYITLINYDGPLLPPADPYPDLRPLNRTKMQGATGLFADLATWITVATFPKRKYGFPQGSNPEQLRSLLVQWLGAGTFTGVVCSLAGLKVAENLSRAEAPKEWCNNLKYGLTNTWSKFPFYLYLAGEGCTQLGRLSHDGTPMPGYADPLDSPYKLPYPKGSVYHCVQGNMGFWGHNAIDDFPALYAYDFALDCGDQVRAARSGILWAFNDAAPPDDDQARGAWLQILHDGPADAKHDLNQAKQAVRTFSEFRHGLHGSVQGAFNGQTPAVKIEMVLAAGLSPTIKQAFANEGVYVDELATGAKVAVEVNNAGAVLGVVHVAQGNPIMWAGSTGKAAFNHLHFHVQPAKYNSNGKITGLDDYTIPVVFQEVKAGLFRQAGVPRSRHYYQSENSV